MHPRREWARENQDPHASGSDSLTCPSTSRLVGSTSSSRAQSPVQLASPITISRADTHSTAHASEDLMPADFNSRNGAQKAPDAKDTTSLIRGDASKSDKSAPKDVRMRHMQKETKATHDGARERNLLIDSPIVHEPVTPTQSAPHLCRESASLSRFTWIDDRAKGLSSEGEAIEEREELSHNDATGASKTLGVTILEQETTARQSVHRHAVSSRSVPHTPQYYAHASHRTPRSPYFRHTAHSHSPTRATASSPSRTVSRQVLSSITETPHAISPLCGVALSHYHHVSWASTAQPQYLTAPYKPCTVRAVIAGNVPRHTALLALRSMPPQSAWRPLRPLSLLGDGLPQDDRPRCLQSRAQPPLTLSIESPRGRSDFPIEESVKRKNERYRLSWFPMATQGRYDTTPVEDATRERDSTARFWRSYSLDPDTGRLSWPEARRSLNRDVHERRSQSQPSRTSYFPKRWTAGNATALSHCCFADAHAKAAPAASRILYSPPLRATSYVSDSLTTSQNDFVDDSSSLIPRLHAKQDARVIDPPDSKGELGDGGALSRGYLGHFLRFQNLFTNVSLRSHGQIILPSTSAHQVDQLAAFSRFSQQRSGVDVLSWTYLTGNWQSPKPSLNTFFRYAEQGAGHAAIQLPASRPSTDTAHGASSDVTHQPSCGFLPTDDRQTTHCIAAPQPRAHSPVADSWQTASYVAGRQPSPLSFSINTRQTASCTGTQQAPPLRLPNYTHQTFGYAAIQKKLSRNLPTYARQTTSYGTARQPPLSCLPVYKRQTASCVATHQSPPTIFLTHASSSSNAAVQTDSPNEQIAIETALVDLPLRRETPRTAVDTRHDDSYHCTSELSGAVSAPPPELCVPGIASPVEKIPDGPVPDTLGSINPTSSVMQPCNSTDDEADHDDHTKHNTNAGARATSVSVSPQGAHRPQFSLYDGHMTTAAYSSSASSDSICWTPLPASRFLHDAPPDAVYRELFTEPQKINYSAPKETADSGWPCAPKDETQDANTRPIAPSRAEVGLWRQRTASRETTSATCSVPQSDDGASSQGKNPRLCGSREMSSHATVAGGQPGGTPLPFPIFSGRSTKDSAAARWEQWLGEKERINEWLIRVQKEREALMALTRTL